ncbi:MAG: polysaccharide biosynthesis/export family protein [Chloracidobacterium sp.]|nr:polysaccharide biosynthesis/export family protein [Chloracidobacterium sp.]
MWKNADLSKQVQVRPDGRISLPLIGDVSAVGRTAAQLTDEISAAQILYGKPDGFDPSPGGQ